MANKDDLVAEEACPTCGRVKAPKLTSLKGLIDGAAFARLARAGFDARPADVPGSYASKSARKRKAAADAAARKEGVK